MAPSTLVSIKEECFISASQEQLLNSIPGWQDNSVAADFTPDEVKSCALEAQRARAVSSSSAESAGGHYGDLESQEGVEWGSPDDSFNGAFESDRDQSPKTEIFSKGLIEDQPEVRGHAPCTGAHDLKEDATDSYARASDSVAPADVSKAGGCLSPPQIGIGGSRDYQTCSSKVQSTEASPLRKALMLASPVSTGSASSLSHHTIYGDRTTPPSPCQDRSLEDPNVRQKKRRKLSQILDLLQEPRVNVPSPSREVASVSHFLEEAHGGLAKKLNDARLQGSRCLEGPNRVVLSASNKVSPSRVEERGSRESFPTPRFPKCLSCKPFAGIPGQAAEGNAACRTLLKLEDVRLGTSEIVCSAHEGADTGSKLAIIVSPLNEELEQGKSGGLSDRSLKKTEVATTTDRCRRENKGAGSDATVPKISVSLERGKEQDQAHASAESNTQYRSEENREVLLQSYAEGSQQIIQAKQRPLTDNECGEPVNQSATSLGGCSFSFESRDAMLEFDTPDLFGQLAKDDSESMQLCKPAEASQRSSVGPKRAEPKILSISGGDKAQHAEISTQTPRPRRGVLTHAEGRRFSPKSVMDVVRHCSGDMAGRNSSDLLSAALQSGVTLPLPFQRKFPFL